MKNVTFVFILTFGLAFSVFGQNEKSPCPKIDVKGSEFVKLGEFVHFTVQLTDDVKTLNLQYNWAVSAGQIVEGVGSQKIKVDIEGLPYTSLVAMVEIKGLPENCPTTFAESYAPEPPAPQATLFDEFGKLPLREIKSRIDNFYSQLLSEPNSHGYIINYGTDREAAIREKQIRNSIPLRTDDASRITFVTGGANLNGVGVWTKIWIVPAGATVPEP